MKIQAGNTTKFMKTIYSLKPFKSERDELVLILFILLDTIGLGFTSVILLTVFILIYDYP